MDTCVIVWFRKDLRVHDHQPLIRAAKSGLPVLGVYSFDPDEYSDTAYGFPKTDRHRAQFIRESVTDLRDTLSDIGVPLLIRHEHPANTFASIRKEMNIESIFLHEEIGSEEQQVEQAVRSELPDTTFVVDHGHNLYHPDDLPFDLQDLPDTFSQFRKKIEKNGTMVRPSLHPPKHVQGAHPPFNPGEPPSLSELGLEELEREPRYRGGSSNARQRLMEYMFEKDRLRVYKETRNGMLKEDDSSKFSPWLANGCLSPKVVYEQILKYEAERVKNKSTYMLYFELLWRDYFHLVHRKHGNRIFFPSGLRDVEVPWSYNKAHAEAWREGETGYPLVDAAMRELKETGFTSNRARQNVASFFTKNLGLDWREGAAWFESQLVDHDVASNYGNWLYIAGVGNDAVQFRAFNVEKQAKDYDPEGAYLRYWLPELKNVPAPWIFNPREMGMVEQEQYDVILGEDYPLPIVDLLAAMQERKSVFLDAMQNE